MKENIFQKSEGYSSPLHLIKVETLALYETVAKQHPGISIVIVARTGQTFKDSDNKSPHRTFDGIVPENQVLVRIKSENNDIGTFLVEIDEVLQVQIKKQLELERQSVDRKFTI